MQLAPILLAILLTACETTPPLSQAAPEASFRILGPDTELSDEEMSRAERAVAAVISAHERDAPITEFEVFFFRGYVPEIWLWRVRPTDNRLAVPDVTYGVLFAEDDQIEIIVERTGQHPCPPFC
jgi:hypothetical protein